MSGETTKHTKVLEVLRCEGKTGGRPDDKRAQVVLAESPFHVAGGGQPGDTGKLRGSGFCAEVLDARRRREDGSTILDLKVTAGLLQNGMEVIAEVDAERNAILSRMHTGQHIFSRLQENACEGLETLKVNIGVDESVVYVHYDGTLSWEGLFGIEEMTVDAIRRDLPVESFLTSREEAEAIPELKAKWERIHDERVRVVRVAGIDATACSGTHVARTGEIGGFMVTGFNGSAPEWEVRFTVRTEDLTRGYTRTMRRLLREVGCPADRLMDVFARQKAENAALRQISEKMRGYLSIPWEERRAADRPLFFALLPGLTKELLSAPAHNCVVEHPDAFCLVLLPDAPEEPFPFILLRGAEVDVDLSGFLKRFPELKARGGGKSDRVNGTTTERSVSVWSDCLTQYRSPATVCPG
ncbi:MAG: alanyl-tRNA editing protein [Synergistaceae bacterium]|jgi:alanyl-tRNA synthetase|nr:alanyl-tRNA editing protein [Synergistaceae bacterium]